MCFSSECRTIARVGPNCYGATGTTRGLTSGRALRSSQRLVCHPPRLTREGFPGPPVCTWRVVRVVVYTSLAESSKQTPGAHHPTPPRKEPRHPAVFRLRPGRSTIYILSKVRGHGVPLLLQLPETQSSEDDKLEIGKISCALFVLYAVRGG